jgi:hypothetical protein
MEETPVAVPIVCSVTEADYADAGLDSTTAETYETQFDSGCQVRAMYSNNTDNQDNHRLSAVSNRAAAGPGESGPCGFLPADTDPTTDGRMGPRETTFTDAAPTPNTNTTKVHNEENPQCDESQKGGHYSDSLVASGGLTQATSPSHLDGGDRSGHGPGHAPMQIAPSGVLDSDDVHTGYSDSLVASGGLTQATSASHPDGGDRSGPGPGHAPIQFTPSGVQHSDEVHTDFSGRGPGQADTQMAPSGVQHADEVHTEVNGDRSRRGPGHAPVQHAQTRVQHSEDSSHNGNSSHNGKLEELRPGASGGISQATSTGRFIGTGKGKGPGGVLSGRAGVTHDPGQAPEPFYARTMHAASWSSGVQGPAVGQASASDSYGTPFRCITWPRLRHPRLALHHHQLPFTLNSLCPIQEDALHSFGKSYRIGRRVAWMLGTPVVVPQSSLKPNSVGRRMVLLKTYRVGIS